MCCRSGFVHYDQLLCILFIYFLTESASANFFTFSSYRRLVLLLNVYFYSEVLFMQIVSYIRMHTISAVILTTVCFAHADIIYALRSQL